ncbi:hypothetical protein INT45_010929 [Circinella minor]|uniref:GRIP domain-containing protein n=1 Tax=Circinella minor TaxID=1195481 RepID=A0A8H7RW22_9FUNG|nr:hypothetical protein INT45_010929 [Circinella minor]
MPNNKKQNQGKQKLQDQIQRLHNELEELRLEREESKKNVLHFMQEADQARQDLEKAQSIIGQLSQQQQSHEGRKEGKQGGLVTTGDDVLIKKTTQILIKLQQLNDPTIINAVWNQLDENQQIKKNEEKLLLEQQKEKDDLIRQQQLSGQQQQIDSLTEQLHEAHKKIKQLEMDKQRSLDELSMAKNEQETAIQARDIEFERAETLEKRWQTSENQLEEAETRIHSLERELESMRQKEWVNKAPSSQLVEKTELDAKCKELKELGSKFSVVQEQYGNLKDQMEQQSDELKDSREKYIKLEEKLIGYRTLENQKDALEQAKIRENHLKTINKTLRDEIRKTSSRNDMEVNMEYLKNVIIKFLEKKQTRAQLIPVLSTLLQCSREEQLRLNKLVRNKISSP